MHFLFLQFLLFVTRFQHISLHCAIIWKHLFVFTSAISMLLQNLQFKKGVKKNNYNDPELNTSANSPHYATQDYLMNKLKWAVGP